MSDPLENKRALVAGQAYAFRYKRFPDRKGAKMYQCRGVVMEIIPPPAPGYRSYESPAQRQMYQDRATRVILNHRPWPGEGGTGELSMEQIQEVYPIERPKGR